MVRCGMVLRVLLITIFICVITLLTRPSIADDGGICCGRPLCFRKLHRAFHGRANRSDLRP